MLVSVALIAIHYSIVVSGGCVDCPTIDQINYVFPDTSNKEISGDFYNGYRQLAQTKDHYRYYDFKEEPTIWIDAPGDILSRSRIITIANEVPPYKFKDGSSNIMANNTAILGVDRWVDDRCRNAIIPKTNWVYYLGDTIQYMQHGCDPKYTQLDTVMRIEIQRTWQDITTSYKYKLDNWIAESKIKCLGICKEY